METTLEQLSHALHTINRHSKTALDPSELYQLKQKTIECLLKQGKAKKIGIHRSPSHFAKQRLDVLIQVGGYYFHLPATKEDKHLKDLGRRDKNHRNPKSRMGLKEAKRVCLHYLKQNGVSVRDKQYTVKEKQYSRMSNQRRMQSTWFERM